MQLLVNEKSLEVVDAISISELVTELKQTGNFAVAVNMAFVPRSMYGETRLKENDKVEIVMAMQGG